MMYGRNLLGYILVGLVGLGGCAVNDSKLMASGDTTAEKVDRVYWIRYGSVKSKLDIARKLEIVTEEDYNFHSETMKTLSQPVPEDVDKEEWKNLNRAQLTSLDRVLDNTFSSAAYFKAREDLSRSFDDISKALQGSGPATQPKKE